MKLLIAVIMLIGVVGTLIPRIPGTLIIFCGALLYGVLTGFASFQPWLTVLLLLLTITAEVGGRWLRAYLTRRYELSRLFCVNASAGNIAGIIAADALLGPILGIVIWEVIVGKTFIPRWSTVGRVIYLLAVAAMLRLICAVVMVILITIYIL
ncbi:DUF456 family protein [Anaerospora sp.]|uniref:DUF456 family protein n=1 Tax=Anaerospora sp. TaxID=1960278 RepID=UPI0028A2063E|nr:DUF456 family protein [Anaerospora sp.]